MEPWKSWAIVGIVGVGAAYYYAQSGKSKRGGDRNSFTQPQQSKQRVPDSKNENKEMRKKKAKAADNSARTVSDGVDVPSASNPSSATEKARKRKGNKEQSSKLAQSTAVDVSREPALDNKDDDARDEELSNTEFAKQMSGLKTGTALKKPGTTDKTHKSSKKQGKSKELPKNNANGTPVEPSGTVTNQEMSTASSTTGADADDDLSLPTSPDLGASQATTVSGGDVSDMLEAPVKGPSVVRITQPSGSQQPTQAKPKKSRSEPETKKQRQNRQKNEEKRALREQAEKERRVLLEKQLRTAREAEGRPAKNGLGTPKDQPTNVWKQSSNPTVDAKAVTEAVPSQPAKGNLLDTFDEDASFLGQISAPANDGASDKSKDNAKGWSHDVPSEEEQIRLINEMDSDNTWNTVAKGKGKKKFAAATAKDSKSTAFNTNQPAGRANKSKLENNFFINGKISSNGDTQSVSDEKETASNPTNTIASNISENPVNSAKTGLVGQDQDDALGQTEAAEEADRSNSGTSASRSPTPTETYTLSNSVTGTTGQIQDDHDAHNAGDQVRHKKVSYQGDVPGWVSKRWRAIAKNLDRDVWNYGNIHEHPDYDSAWPYALTGHPMDSDWAGDWDSDDMKKANERRSKEESELKARKERGEGF